MTFETIWQAYIAGGAEQALATKAQYAKDSFYLGLLAFGEQQYSLAAQYIKVAHDQSPDHTVYAQAIKAIYHIVEMGRDQGVYVDGEAFAEFIRTGGNVSLYQETSGHLRRIYDEYNSLTLLDIGVGDGMALLPALTSNIIRIDLVEPSEVMLEKVRETVVGKGFDSWAANTTIQRFIKEANDHWQLAQATFSLQSIPPEERSDVFQWLAKHTDRLLIVEFDVPDFTHMFEPKRVEYVIERYADGLAEYANQGDLVPQGFLMPVMFGMFDTTAHRTNWEQPINTWIETLQQNGFNDIRTEKVFDYWWATARLIDAKSST